MMNELSREKEKQHYIVAIGASAGGLEAINDLVDHIPARTGFSFVILQHLSPDYRSLMGELLSKHTEMQVFEARTDMELKPDTVYLLPPAMELKIKNGRLIVLDKIRDHQPNNVIDTFFRSLAEDQHERAIAVILSGTGTDGTKGIQAIKQHNGTVVVQDPITAQFDGMPNSAISSGYIDLILSPDMMAEELVEFVKEAPFVRSFNAVGYIEEAILLDILELVYKATRHDFSNYKRPTITRRLARRMAECHIKSLKEYHNYLTAHPEEVTNLCKEFLLHVTQFFRDEEAFKILKTQVIPDIFVNKSESEPLKIWCVGCSTGEEAYSLGMLVLEIMEDMHSPKFDVKIFATDISQDVIEFASRGIYSVASMQHMSEDRLNKFFTRESGGYRVSPDLRKLIVFAKHDILKDPPFSKIDLLTCRNMLIYMNPLLQRNILQKFHFSLNPGGILFLGPSENATVLKDVVEEINKKWKIYRCVSKHRNVEPEFLNPEYQRMPIAPVTIKAKNALQHLPDIFRETLMEEEVYAGIFIDKDFEVKQAIGNFKRFMDFPEGSFNFNLLKMVSPDLSIVLSTSIRKCLKDNQPVIQRQVKVTANNETRFITVIIKPYVVQKQYLQPFLFIVLKEDVAPTHNPHVKAEVEEGTLYRVQELESELHDTKENLQALLEEVESSNEELQSSNEEIISANEELQSTNEELQSLNEELHTVNAEHQLKIRELVELNDDFNNYFRNTNIGQVLVDRKLIVRKFTPSITKLINLNMSDIGRSIADISNNLKNLDFLNEVKEVLKSGVAIEKNIEIRDGRNYLMRIAPYLRQNSMVDGVVVNFVDITDIKKLSSILEAVFNSSTSGILALETIRGENNEIVDYKFISANRAVTELMGMPDPVNKTFRELYDHVEPVVFNNYKSVSETGETKTFEYYNSIRDRWYDIVCVKMLDGLVVTFNDITERKAASQKIQQGYDALQSAAGELQDTNKKLEQSNLDLMQFASVASHDLKEPLRKIQAFGNLLEERTKDKLDESEHNYLHKMISASGRMQMLIDDILTLSRLSDTGTEKTPVDLNHLINQIVDDLEISIKERDAKIHVDQLPETKGIPGQLHQLFQNLISNSIKFSQTIPEIRIKPIPVPATLEKEFEIDGKDYNAISIKDNGIGFDEQYSAKIFGIFQRLDSRKYKGSGIGLAIVKKVIDNHHGYIKAISKENDGAEFIVLFPKEQPGSNNGDK